MSCDAVSLPQINPTRYLSYEPLLKQAVNLFVGSSRRTHGHAEWFYLQVVEYHTEKYHPKLALSLVFLGDVLRYEGDLNECEDKYQDALKIYEHLRGDQQLDAEDVNPEKGFKIHNEVSLRGFTVSGSLSLWP